jgi:hypothetical protein
MVVAREKKFIKHYSEIMDDDDAHYPKSTGCIALARTSPEHSA